MHGQTRTFWRTNMVTSFLNLLTTFCFIVLRNVANSFFKRGLTESEIELVREARSKINEC